jgi:hypothetical protein
LQARQVVVAAVLVVGAGAAGGRDPGGRRRSEGPQDASSARFRTVARVVAWHVFESTRNE